MRIKKGKITIEVDADTYCYLINRYYFLDFSQHKTSIRNRNGIQIPIWRISRRCLNSLFKVQYLDGNKYNLKRTNLRLIRKTQW